MAGYFDDPKYRAQPAAPKSGGYFSDPKYIASPTTTPPVEDPGYIETGITSVARGGGSIVSGLGAAAEWAGDVTGSQGLRQFGQEAQKLGTQIIEGPGKLEGPSFTGTFVENPSFKRAFSLATEAVPSLALGLATGGATALGLRGAGLAATTARTAGTLAGAGTLGVTEGAPQYIEAKQAGKSVGKASAIGAASTIGTTALEFIGLGSLIKGAAKGAIKGAVKGFVSEGTQEATQQIWQNLVAKLGYDESKSLVEGVVESFIAGSGSGAAVGGVTGRINSRRDTAQTALLTKHFPNAEVKVTGGVANIKYQSDTGAVEAQIPVANLSKAIAAGVNVEDLIGISSAVKQGVEAATTEQKPKPKFERLEDLPENPAVLRMSIDGNEYQYLPKGDMSRVDMEAQLEGKTLPQQVAWLRKNADLIRGPKDAQEDGTRTEEGSTQEGTDRGESERLRVRGDQQSGEGQATQEVTRELPTTPETDRTQAQPLEGATQAPVTEAAEVGGAPPLFSVEQVKQEAKSFLGEGYDALENSGKIAVVNTEAELPTNIKSIIPPGSKVRGVYDPVSKKVYLVAGSLQQGMAKDVILHEGVHAILREDTAFSSNREKILSDFVSIADKNASVREALAKVPGATQEGRINEEALAYWMQNPKNHKHSLFRRIIATVKAAMFRAGIPTGKLSTADLSKIFTGGIQIWARAAQSVEVNRQINEQPEQMFSLVSDELKKVQNKAETIAKAAANPKATGKRIYESTASTWLGVLPPSFKAQVFKIPYLKNLVDHTNSLIATKTKIADDSFYIYDNAVKVANSEKGIDTLNNALLVGTFNQMYPWAGVMEQDWVPASVENEDGTTTTNNAARLNAAEKAWKTAGMKKSTGKTFREAHAEAYKAWNAMGPKTKTEALKIIDSLTELRQRERDNLLKYITEASQDDPALRAELMARFDASFNQLKGIYAPLSRYGNWTVDYITPTGQRSSNFFDTELDRDEFVKTITAEGVDPNNIVTSIKKETPNGAVVIPNELVQQITGKLVRQYTAGVDPNDAEAMADAQERARDVVSDINQTFLRWLPDTSALKNSIHRKNVLGASTDMMRSYLDYMQRHASKIAWMEVGKKLDLEVQNFAQDIREQEKERGVDTTMQVQLLNDARRWLQAIRTEKVNAAASIAGKISTAYYMTSPSTFLVQLTQLPALTLPNLGTRFGYGPSSKSLSTALLDAFSPKYSKEAMLADDKVNEVYEAIHAVVSEREATPENPVGTERLTEAEKEALIKRELNDDQKRLLMLREAVAMNLLDISAVHEAQDISFGRETTIAGKLMKYAMLPMQHGELGSRKAAALATYDLAKGKSFYQTMDEIKKTIDETLYSYAKENKGYLLQGSVPRVLLTFQTYRINTALRLGMLMAQSVKGETAEVRKAAQREFVGIMGMSSALAGTAGTVISPLVFAIANILFGSDDEPYDAELEFTNWLKESLGQTAGEAAAYGLPTLLGTNISKRIGMGDIYGTSTEPPPGTHGSDLAYWYAGNLLGPSFSVAQSWFRGYDEIVNKGNYLKGLEVGSPKPIKDALKAYRIATEGLKTGSGKKLLDDSAIGPDEIFMTALGFNPDEIASAQNAERSLQKLSAQISERRGKLIRDAANAIVDSEDPEKAYQAIRTFNSRMPRFTILGRDIAPAVRKQLLGEFGTTGLRERMVAEEYGIDVKTP